MSSHAKHSLPLAVAGIVLLVAAAYAPIWSNGFVAYDDTEYLTQNEIVQRGLTLDGARWAFTQAHAANWHPLTWLSHMLDCELFGLAPRAHHLVNLGLHAATAVLVMLAFRSLTGTLAPCALAAALWAVHPLRVESVAWAAERKDVLGGFFWFASLWAYALWARRGGPARYLASLLLFALGLLSKPTVVTLPFALLVVDFWPLARLERGVLARRIAEKLPFLALAVLAAAATVIAQRAGQAVAATEDIPLAWRIENALVAYCGYLRQLAWPSDLVVFQPHPLGALSAGTVAACAALMLALSALAWATRRSAPYWLMGWAWFLGTLVPMIGLVQAGGQARADRYTYIAQVGLFIAASFGWFALVRRARAPLALRAALPAIALVALSAATAAQVGVWRDTETLFRHALAHTEANYVIENGLADHLLETGRAREALSLATAAAERFPDFRKGRYNLVRALVATGDRERAQRELDDWLARHPDDLAFPADLARAWLAAGDFAGAARNLETALAIHPGLPELQNRLGRVRLAAGERDRAAIAFNLAEALAPDSSAFAADAAAARSLARGDESDGEARRLLREIEELRRDPAASARDWR